MEALQHKDIDNVSEEENEMNIINTAKKSSRLHKIVDSFSDSDSAQADTKEKLYDNVDTDINVVKPELSRLTNRHRKLQRILDSDSDSDNSSTISSPKHCEKKTEDTNVENCIKKKLKRVAIQDSSDSEDQDSPTPHNKSFPDEKNVPEAVIYSANNKGELVPEKNINQKSRYTALLDSESSDEDFAVQLENEEEPQVETQPKKFKNRQTKNDGDKLKRMSYKDAAQQKHEIQSYSQKRVRESNISLPYHKSKTYTIKEFLEKRSKLPSASSLLPKMKPSIAMKMSKDMLVEISKKVNERIKEVAEFYKSESEEDEETEEKKDIENTKTEIRSWLDLLVIDAMNTVDKEEIDNEEPKTVPEENETANDSKNKSKESESMDYEFNLDDPEAENFENENATANKQSVSELLKEKFDTCPRLCGNPDDVIDLESGEAKPGAIKLFVDKLFKNSTKKHPLKHKVKLDVVGVRGGGEIVKETLSMEVDDEEERAMVETPGAKLQKLREELQDQMAQKRSQLWKQKHEQGDLVSSVGKDLEECDNRGDAEENDDYLDDEEEEFEMTESSSENEELDDEEGDGELKEAPRLKSAFVEDEAEDTDGEDNDIIDNNDENEEPEVDDDGFDGDEESGDQNEEYVKQQTKKTLKRIIRPFAEDSDDEDQSQNKIIEESCNNQQQKEVDSTASCDDDVLPPNLPRIHKTPQRPTLDRNKSEFDFLTPVSYLTGLQNLDSKFLKDSPGISPFRLPVEPSPLKERDWQSTLQKKLFVDLPTDQSSQDNLDELAGLCSGNFSSETQVSSSVEHVEEPSCTQDLLNICSGDFSSGVISQINLESQRSVNNIDLDGNVKEIKSLGEDQDQIISQLIDEDELERFRKKFESPVNDQLNKKNTAEEVQATGVMIDSDDENDGLELRKKKKQKKLTFSDDEDSSDNEKEEEEEEINLHDTDPEESGESNRPADDVAYDSEENEIPTAPRQAFKASDFFEEEAELSESEWGSADEDEKDLDKLEFEQGDDDVFDENKVRTDLERIHMRQLLDEDNREVKLLQELLLEDGELHGSGRQRQFKWKNIDSFGGDEDAKKDDDDVYLDEEESEEQWRKMRHQREMFLKEKAVNEDVTSILKNSQILKVGQVVLRKSQSFGSHGNEVDASEAKSDEILKEPFGFMKSKKGSFLGRKDQVLQRVAEYTKVSNNVGGIIKNSRNFLFQTVESVESTTIIKERNKRKAVDGTPNAIKKLRLTSELSPIVKKQTPKNGGAKTKLF